MSVMTDLINKKRQAARRMAFVLGVVAISIFIGFFVMVANGQ